MTQSIGLAFAKLEGLTYRFLARTGGRAYSPQPGPHSCSGFRMARTSLEPGVRVGPGWRDRMRIAMTTHTIGQLARLAGVPTSTVRFYERAGLLRPDARSGGNYRHYGDAAVGRLRFIRSAQATGFSLGDIRELLSLTHAEEAPCDEVLALTKQRLADV